MGVCRSTGINFFLVVAGAPPPPTYFVLCFHSQGYVNQNVKLKQLKTQVQGGMDLLFSKFITKNQECVTTMLDLWHYPFAIGIK